VEADRAELARARRPGEPVADDGAAALLDRLAWAAARLDGAGLPNVAGWHATAQAEQTRWEGRADPATWAAAAAAWERLGRPYRLAYARFRQAEALRRAATITAHLGAVGRSNGQIAQALFISPKTASVHVSNILAKLGVHTRVEAAAVAHRLGLD
jgi:DNA-binding CsgD family transcriptional regulator